MSNFIQIPNLYLGITFIIIITIFLIPLVFAENAICTDSDNGQNFFVKGRMIDSKLGYDYSDYCTSSDRLVEFYCNPGYTFVYEDCSNHGKICEKGICIDKSTPPSTTPQCTYETGGCTSTSEWCYNNQCISCSQGFYNCDGIKGCESSSPCGTTVPTPTPTPTNDCTDSDNGQNFFVKGRMIDSKLGYDYSDYCTSSDRLVEFYCNPGYTFVYEDCSNLNSVCVDGACIKKEVPPAEPNKCQDGTSYGKCSLTKPKYCDNGNLIDSCQICGCSDDITCNEDGTCSSPQQGFICTDISILGDADNDDEVSYEDYITVYNIATGSIQPPSNICCIDLNKDDEITLDDAQLTYDVYVGKKNFGRCSEFGCIVGDSCTTPKNCPGTYESDCYCVDTPNDNCPVVVTDKDKPVISDVEITPEAGPSGTIFTINAKVEDESALKLIITTIYILNNDKNSVGLVMYDDGQHNDEQANDGIYGTLLDSTGYEEGLYGFGIGVRDYYNNDESTIKFHFLIGKISDLCKEVIPGHNNIDEPRANIVFVGINYPDKEFFKSIMEESVDIEGNKQGLLSLEPLKSNKDKFNFWYVDETYDFGFNYWDNKEASRSERIRLSLMCPISNKYVITFYNTFFRPQAFYKSHAELAFLDVSCSFRQYCNNADLDKDGCVSGKDYLEYSDMTFAKDFKDKSVPDINKDGDISGDDLEVAFLCQQYRVGCSNEYKDCLRRDYFDDSKTYVGHEFGHLFGDLNDEYLEKDSKVKIGARKNCFQGTKEACLSNLNDKWHDLLGYGCGDNNEIDCAREFTCQYDADEDEKVTMEDANIVYKIHATQGPLNTCISKGGCRKNNTKKL